MFNTVAAATVKACRASLVLVGGAVSSRASVSILMIYRVQMTGCNSFHNSSTYHYASLAR